MIRRVGRPKDPDSPQISNPTPATHVADIHGLHRVSLLPNRLLFWHLRMLACSGRFTAMFSRGGNTGDTIKAIVSEIRARAANGRVEPTPKQVAWMQSLDPLPCACGRKGTHVVGQTTYCSHCVVGDGVARLKKRADNLEKKFAARGEDIAQTFGKRDSLLKFKRNADRKNRMRR